MYILALIIYIRISHNVQSAIHLRSKTLFSIGLIRLQEILRFSKGEKVNITVRKLDHDPGNWVYMFKDMSDKKEKRIIVDCDVSKVFKVLQKVGYPLNRDSLLKGSMRIASLSLSVFAYRYGSLFL